LQSSADLIFKLVWFTIIVAVHLEAGEYVHAFDIWEVRLAVMSITNYHSIIIL
jgi:hypothetical protein